VQPSLVALVAMRMRNRIRAEAAVEIGGVGVEIVADECY